MTTTAENRVYVGTDGRIRAYGDFPTRYTREALHNRVQHYANTALPAAAYAVQLTQEVKESVRVGVIDADQARRYCQQMGLPTPIFQSDRDALAALEEAVKE